MYKILKYSFFDLMRSRWTLIYCSFFMLFSFSLLFLSNDLSKVIISLMNVVLMLCPLIATMFGVMYYYNSREFVELLLAQPVRRRSIFLGLFAGLSISLTASLVIGIGIPFIVYGVFQSAEIWNFGSLIVMGVILSVIFSALAFLIALKNENKIKGFGMAILAWLFFAIIYDGIFLLSLSLMQDYPLKNFSIAASLFNPIDLARIFILLKLDISALMGYTGAVFQTFFGSPVGMVISALVLMIWMILPGWQIGRVAARKDF